MAVPNPVMCYGLRPGTSYVWVVEIDSVSDNLTVDLSADVDWYMAGTGHDNDILRALREALETHSEGPTFDVYLNSSGRLVVELISTGGAGSTVEFMWDDGSNTLPSTWLGFAHNSATDTTQTGSYVPEGVFFPGRPFTVDSRVKKRPVGNISVAMSGKTRATRFAAGPDYRNVTWDFLPKERALQEYNDEPYNSFEYAWDASLSKGRTFLLFDDVTAIAAANAKPFKLTALDYPLDRSNGYNVYWSINIECVGDTGWSVTDRAVDLTGAGSYLTGAKALGAETGATWAFWINLQTAATSVEVLLGQQQSGEESWVIYLNASNYLSFGITPSVGFYQASSFATATWRHVVLTWDSTQASATQFKLYIDGKQVGIAGSGTTPSALTSTDSVLGIGGAGDGTYTDPNAYLDEICIYNRVLSGAEAYALYDLGPDRVNKSGLVRRYDFNYEWHDSVERDNLQRFGTVATTTGAR